MVGQGYLGSRSRAPLYESSLLYFNALQEFVEAVKGLNGGDCGVVAASGGDDSSDNGDP